MSALIARTLLSLHADGILRDKGALLMEFTALAQVLGGVAFGSSGPIIVVVVRTIMIPSFLDHSGRVRIVAFTLARRAVASGKMSIALTLSIVPTLRPSLGSIRRHLRSR